MGKSSYREKSKEKRLAGQVSLALAAGMFSVVPVAHGMPTVDTSQGAHADYTQLPEASGNTMNVQGSRTNNVIDWKDFSIAHDETVNFQKVGNNPANYMNIVTGNATSNIAGQMNNPGGEVYLINPNGVIFGATAQVNVGNLYVSTRAASQVDIAAFRGDDEPEVLVNYAETNVGDVLSAVKMDAALKADVVNLIDKSGYVKADKVVMEGRNIRFLNSSSAAKADVVTDNGNGTTTTTSYVTGTVGNYSVEDGKNSAITLRVNSDGYIHVGDEKGEYTYTAEKVTTLATDAEHPATITTVTGTKAQKEEAGVVNYALIHDAADINKITSNTFNNPTNKTANNDLTGNYMLANDIVDGQDITKPIGTGESSNTTLNPNTQLANAYTGKFDGMFFTVENLNNTGKLAVVTPSKPNNSFMGLFGVTNGATIENVGVKNAKLSFRKSGGIVGYANNTTLRNVWNEGRADDLVSVGTGSFNKATGGLVGVLNNSTLTNAYNESYVSGGGLVGMIQGVTDSTKVVIRDAYNTGKLVSDGLYLNGIATGYGTGNRGIVKNVYTASLYTQGDYRANKGTKTEEWEILVGAVNSTDDIQQSYIINGLDADGNTLKRHSQEYDVYRPDNSDNPPVWTAIKTNGTAEGSYVFENINSKDFYNNWLNISADWDSDATWRIYENLPVTGNSSKELKKASLPLLTSFFQGTVSTDYTYDKNGTPTTVEGGQVRIPVLDESGNPVLDGNNNPTYTFVDPTKVYDANSVAPTVTDYYGMKGAAIADSDLTIHTNDNLNAKTFALFYGGQRGYNLYGNNFTIEKRKIGFTQQTAPTFTKVYDGNADATDALAAALLNAGSGSTTGFIGSDKDYVKLTVKTTGTTASDHVTATYGRKTDNAWTEKSDVNAENAPWDVMVTGANSDTIQFGQADGVDAAHKDTWLNYELDSDDITALNNTFTGKGVITPRAIKVTLLKDTGIDKTYDGSSALVGTFSYTDAESVVHDNVSYATGNLQAALDTTDLTAEELTAITTELGGSAAVASGYGANYVDGSGNATKNVADTTGSTNHVAYTGIKLFGVTLSSNYVITDKYGEALAQTDAEDASKGYTLKASGAITKRNIDSADFGGGTTLRKTYDGTSTYTAPSGTQQQAVTVGDNAVTAEHATDIPQDKTAPEGLLVDDVDLVKFITAGTGTFLDKDGVETKNATNYKGTNTGAQKAQYNVQLTNDSDDIAIQNYKLDGVDLAFKQADGVTTKTYGVEGAGIIDKRAIAVELVTNSDLDKTYNGTADLDAGTAANYKNGSISIGGGATGNLRYAQGSETIAATDTGVNISITNAAYADQNVAYDGSGNVTDKNITYTVAFNDADAAYNYTLNTVASTTAPASTTLAATGEISPKELSLSFGSADKTYDGDALVHTIPTVTINNLVTGDSADDVLDTAKIAGRYGSDATGTFVTSANVGNYTTEAATAGAKVLYTGLKNNDGTYKDIKTAIKDTIKGKNYTISNTVYGKGIISKKTISTTDLDTATSVKNGYTPLTKVYDGSPTDSSTAVTGLSWSDYLVWNDDQTVFAPTDRDNLTITIAEAIYTNKNVNDPESPQAVSLKYNIKGTAAANYEFVGDTVTTNADGSKTIAYTKAGYTGTITPRTVTVTMKDGVTSPTKIYDGTTTVKATGVTTTAGVSRLDNGTWSNWFQLANVVDGEDLQLANGITVAYASEDVAYNNTGAVTTQAVNYGNVALANGTNSLASNYTLVNDIQGVGTINKRNVTLSDYGVATATKTYDTDADVEAYALKFVNGNDTTDWDVLATDGITKNADGTVNANGLVSYGLTGTYLPTGSQTEGQGKDVLRDSTNRATILAKNVEYIDDPESNETPLANLFGGNYNVTLANGGTYDSTTGKLTVTGGGKINPAEIDLTGAGVDTGISRAYNRLNTITRDDAINHITGVSANNLAMLDVSGTFTEGANVKRDAQGNVIAQPIALTITMLNTSEALNYDLKDGVGSKDISGTGKITPVTVSVSLNQPAVEKVYDGGTALKANGADIEADVVKGWFSVSGIGGETLSVANVTGEYADKNAGDTKTINYTGITLGNGSGTNAGLASNYQLSSTTKTGTGKITPKPITFNITPELQKYYDRTTGLSTTDQDGTAGVLEANTTTVNGENGAVKAWKDENIFAGDEFNFSGLTGIYGSWDLSSNTFTENSHVNATNGVPETKDILYTFTGVTGADAGNYTLLNGTGANLKAENNNITTTAYFYAARDTGKIRPLAVTMANVASNSTPTYKVYDGTNMVNGYLPDGTETNYQNYFNVFYDHNGDGDFVEADGDVPLGYTATATYTDTVEGANDGKNAGTNKAVKYANFELTTNATVMGDYGLTAETIAAINNYYNDPAHADELPTTGSIARRLLVVAPNRMDIDHTKTYDGTATVLNAPGYMVGALDLTNGTGAVNDQVSITYAANFAKTGNEADAADVNITNAQTGAYTNKNVEYTFELKGDDKENYTLAGTPNTTTAGGVASNDGAKLTYTQTGRSTITPKTVIVRFKDGKDQIADKLYNGNDLALVGEDMKEYLDVTGLLGTGTDGVTFNYGDVTKKYIASGNGEATKDVAMTGNRIDTKTVYVQNLTLSGNRKGNYVVKANSTAGQALPSTTTPETNEQTLVASGRITPRTLDVEVTGNAPTKVYDGTKDVKYTDGNLYQGKTFEDSDSYIRIADATTSGTDGLLAGEHVNFTVDSALYSDPNADTGIGITYKLKWDNKNYELLHYSIDSQGEKVATLEGTGNITKRTLTYNTGDTLSVNKTYDGTPDITDTSSVTSGIFAYAPVDVNGQLTTNTGLIRGEDVQLSITGGSGKYYTDNTKTTEVSDTGAAADSKDGKNRTAVVGFTIGNTNYKLDVANNTTQIQATDSTHGTYTGTGRIDRAQLTLTPNNVTYSAGDNIPADGYAGSVTGWKNGESLADGYDVTFKRDPQNLSTAPGNYQLLGYVNGDVAPTANGMVYYNNLGNTGNYYFVTAPNQALRVEAKADVADAVHRDTIADKKFIPDDYSYNRMSQDEDLTRLKRESQATVQYTEKGVNTDESSQGGLLASMDIQGAGSVVNLNGAVIRTSAVPEKPEEIAAEAALPVSEASEADFSSIDVENTDESDDSQSMLEVLTNASNKAENRGTSIVINTMDEDEEDAEEEKSRRALIVDRSNIGIETLGDAVNLDQMIG